MKRALGIDYQPERNVRPYERPLQPSSTNFYQNLFMCKMSPVVGERSLFYSRIKYVVQTLEKNNFDLEKITAIYKNLLINFDCDKMKLKELANWVREYVNNEENLFGSFVQGVVVNRNIYESLLMSIQKNIAGLVSKISKYLAVESVIASDAERLSAVIIRNFSSARSLDKHPVLAENLKEIVESIVDDFIKNGPNASQFFDYKKMRSMAKRILRKWLLNPLKIDNYKKLYCLERKVEIKINPLEINEFLDNLLSHMDRTSVYKFNFVSKKCHFVVENFFQNGWFNVLSKNTPVIRDLSQFHEYATSRFDLKLVKKNYIKEDSSNLLPLYNFQNLEYLSLNNCPNLIKFSHFKFLKVLDLSFCSNPMGRYIINHYLSDCTSLEKLKLYKCNYAPASLTAFLSDEKFSQKKITLISQKGEKYKGCFQKGKYHGDGEIKHLDGTIYKGNFEGGKYHGQGRFIYPWGDVYEGNFKNYAFDGEGVFTYVTGGTYKGTFKNDVFHGKGVRKFANGDIYEGDYVEDLHHGKGVFKFADGGLYEGDFENGKFHGKGAFKYRNGNIYEGDFVEGIRHGQGRFTYANGNIYEGEFKKGAFVHKKP